MKHQEIRDKFLTYFKSKGHAIVPSSSLLPTDPSVLFTTAGMQQFKPYYTGEADATKDFGSLNTASIQKSMRTSDIEEVGDHSHLTFFEMLGNFSFGGYWKQEAIAYAHEFITKELGLEISYVTIFKGSDVVPKDEESRSIWQALGIQDIREEGMDDVFWGPTGSNGPCGPTTEIYCRNSEGKDIEVWNIVFNEFYCDVSRDELLAGKATLKPLGTRGIDTGMGLERLAMIAQKRESLFETDLFEPLIQILPGDTPLRVQRIMADHARSTAFLISDGVVPSNKEQGYVLRRLMRRLIVHAHTSGIEIEAIKDMLNAIVQHYGPYYPNLNPILIMQEFDKENSKFEKTFKNGLRELEKLSEIDSASAFRLFESFGLPYEVIKEMGGEKAKHLTHRGFDEEFKKHQERSRAGAEKKFGGHGLKEGETAGGDAEETKKKTRLHTATHIVVAALEKVLGEPLKQAGADINVERLRFDFAFPRKVTPEELQKAEEIANKAVADDLEVWNEELPLEEAFASGAHGAFAHKYPPRVKVYTIGKKENYFSREICGGPHVTHTAEVGRIKITKEESASGGNRRVRATIE
jgi:alanyl-tRNA synthetase